jgi:F-box-like
MPACDLVPNEILSEIFRDALPYRLDEDGRFAFRNIRSVCSRWRSISFSSPHLWSSLSVIIEHNGPDIGTVPRLDAWFSRSGPSIPLEFEYDNDFLTRDLAESNDKDIFKRFIGKYQSRWRYLSLVIESNCFWDTLLYPPSTDWHNLHVLKMWTLDVEALHPETSARALDTLTKMGSLRRLVLDGAFDTDPTERWGPPRLEELHIEVYLFFGIHDMDFICSYSELKHLTLSVPGNLVLRLLPEDHFTLPSLLSFTHQAYDLFVLRHFTTPALKSLDIQLHTESDVAVGPDSEFLAGFLARCTNALQAFGVCSDCDPSFVARLLPVLSARPSLTIISVDVWPSNVEMGAFSQAAEKGWCPNLRSLSVRIRASDGVELEQMQDLSAFLGRRKEWGRASLKTLTFRKESIDFEFPSHVFDALGLGKLQVMVPW